MGVEALEAIEVRYDDDSVANELVGQVQVVVKTQCFVLLV